MSQQYVIQRAPQNDTELWYAVRAAWGVKIPRVAVCEDHCAPFDAFAEAYFARTPIAIWKASRGFGGKTQTLSLLGMSELAFLGAFVTILGGSGEQSRRVHETMSEAWHYRGAPKHLLARDPTKNDTYLSNGGKARTLMASSRSVRGPHPQRLRMDEIDEMELAILTAAQGQPMRKQNQRGEMLETNTVFSSTHQYPDGCVVAETPVLTKRGEIPIIEVTTDDYVMTRQGWRRVDAMILSGYRNVVEVTLSNGRVLTCTDDHRIAANTPDGWNIPRWMSVGDEVYGINPEFVVPEPLFGPRNLAESEPTISCLEAGADSLASFAETGTPVVEGSVLVAEWMVVDTLGFGSVDGCGADASKNIGGLGNSTEAIRPDAGVNSALVVDLESFGDGSNKAEVSPAMSTSSEVFPVDPTVPLGLSALPEPVLRVSSIFEPNADNTAPGTEPVFIVDISHTNRVLVPVYDLQVQDVHEFFGAGIVIHNTMTYMLREAAERGWSVRSWCYKECSNPLDGWLKMEEVERKRSEVPASMFAAEYDLQEPNFQGRAIDEESVNRMFDPAWAIVDGKEGFYYQFIDPRPDRDYITGVDWAKKQDFTIITTWDTTVLPWKLAAFEKINRRPWPVMIGRLNKRWAMYGGTVVSDALGIGSVINDYIEFPRGSSRNDLVEFSMAGKVRSEMITELVQAVENGDLLAPRVKSMFDDFRFVTPEDLYNVGSTAHLPDSIASTALAWTARKRQERAPASVISLTRDNGSPWKI